MALRQVMAFTINAHLVQENGEKFYFPFTVLGKDYYKAEGMLEKYLKENKKDTGLKYRDVVGFRADKTERIVMDVSDDNYVLVFNELLNQRD